MRLARSTIQHLKPRAADPASAGTAAIVLIERNPYDYTLRQRRFRERRAALRNASEALQSALLNTEGDGDHPGEDGGKSGDVSV
jgi:hypothetical protein